MMAAQVDQEGARAETRLQSDMSCAGYIEYKILRVFYHDIST